MMMEPPPKPLRATAATQDSATRFSSLEILSGEGRSHHKFITPIKRVNDGTDVVKFHTSKAYRDIGIFIMQLNRAMCPRKTASGPSKQFPLIGGGREDPESVKRLVALLQKLDAIIDEAPPHTGPRRFGNTSFRKWCELVEERADGLLWEHLCEGVVSTDVDVSDSTSTKVTGMDEVRAYFVVSFGSAQRLDYGTGHELNFLAFLGCVWKLGGFADGGYDGSLERSIVLGVFETYLKLTRKLILTYTLEPAGSHGVWGLDDHSFLPYMFGSAQHTRPITEDEPMPLEGSVEHAPKPMSITSESAVTRLQETSMYFSAISFISDVKKGPFHEHSPDLFSISQNVKDGWGKINKGMIKMYNAEVLSKFPVVQHFYFGSLFSWDQDPEASTDNPLRSIHLTSQPQSPAASAPAPPAGPGTRAPWAPSPSSLTHTLLTRERGEQPQTLGRLPHTGRAPTQAAPTKADDG